MKIHISEARPLFLSIQFNFRLVIRTEKTFRVQVKITRNLLKNDSPDTCCLRSEINISALGELTITIIQVDRTSVSLQLINRKEEVSCRYKLFTYVANTFGIILINIADLMLLNNWRYICHIQCKTFRNIKQGRVEDQRLN